MSELLDGCPWEVSPRGRGSGANVFDASRAGVLASPAPADLDETMAQIRPFTARLSFFLLIGCSAASWAAVAGVALVLL